MYGTGRPRRDYLFNHRATVSQVVESQRRSLKTALDELSSDQILARPLDDVVGEIVDKFRIDVPVLARDRIVEFPAEEVDIDVTNDPSRIIMSPGPHYVKGTRLTIGIPFAGDPDVFQFPESSFAIPIEGFVDKESRLIVLSHDSERPDPQAIRREFEARIEQVAHALEMIRGRVGEWNQRLTESVRNPLTQRRDKLSKDGSLSLGYGKAAPPPLPSGDHSRVEKRGSALFGRGEQFDALREFQRLVACASRSIIFIDAYVDSSILDSLSGKRDSVTVRLLTKAVKGPLMVAARAFNAQHKGLSIRTSSEFHDRFLIVDDTQFYHFGASIKDAGKRVFRIAEIQNADEQKTLMTQFLTAWGAGRIEPC